MFKCGLQNEHKLKSLSQSNKFKDALMVSGFLEIFKIFKAHWYL